MALAPSAYPKLLNIRSYSPDRIESRPGSVLVNDAPLSDLIVHSLRRLNNSIPGSALSFTRVVGAGTSLYSGQASIAQRDTGYSGNPLALVPYRPAQSPETWIYVGDSNKMAKIDVNGTVYHDGIAPPLQPPTSSITQILLDVISDFSSATGWAWDPSTSITAAPTGRLSTTITRIVYDSGTSGWASIQLATSSLNIGAGSLITLNTGSVSAETVEIQGLYLAVGATAIAAIAYDTGTTGTATVYAYSLARAPWSRAVNAPDTLSYNHTGVTIQPNILVLVNSGGGNEETVQLQSVTGGFDGTASFRAVFANTHVINEPLQFLTTMRVFLANNHVIGETVTAAQFSQALSAGPQTLAKSDALDLSQIGGRPLQDDDEFHLSINLSNLSSLVEGRVLLDVDASSNDFTQNYYMYPFRANDLTSATNKQTTILSARQQSIQRSQVDTAGGLPANYNTNIRISQTGDILPPLNTFPQVPYAPSTAYQPPFSVPISSSSPVIGQTSGQTGTGNTQWTELHFKLSDLQRVGTDTSRTLANVAAVGIYLNLSGSATVLLSSLTISGTYGPDVGATGDSYLYRFRYRSSKTGAVSQWSPPQRTGLRPHRQLVGVTAISSADPQVDRIDYARFGGAITSWILIGYSDNASPILFDIYQDSDIANAPLAELDNYRPFPTVDVPHSGTVNVAGTRITWNSGDTFNPLWAPGSIIQIAGTAFTLYNYPQDATHLDLVESIGNQAGVPYTAPQATLDAQPLPAMWGPFQNMLLACGSPYQPGALFTTKGNNPDAASDSGWIEITTPSEPLMNGCMFYEQSFVFSCERMFQIYPDTTGQNVLAYQQVDTIGIYSRWGLCVGDAIYGISRTGIFRSYGGGGHTMITDPDLTLLFPHEGIVGQPVSLGSAIFQPPDFSHIEALRLSWMDGHLKFRYIDQNGDRACLVWNSALNVWSVDDDAYHGVTDYQEEAPNLHSNLIGGADGNVYQENGTTDNGVSFQSEARMAYIGDGPGFMHSRDGYIGLYSGNATALVVNVDGTDYTHALASTTSSYQKPYTITQAMKGKAWEWALVGAAPWKLFMGDCAFRMKAWAGESYQPFRPFAHMRRLTSGGQ